MSSDPAASRAALHARFVARRARPLGVVLAAGLLLAIGVLPFVLPRVTPLDWLYFLLTAGGLAAGVLRITRVQAVPDEEGLTVRNVFTTTRLTWPEVVEVRFGGGGPWAVLDLADGETLPVMGIQRADGARAEREARRLATLVALHSRTERDD